MRTSSRALLALALCLVAAAAHAWWNKDWANRKTITLDAGPTGSVSLAAPVHDARILVRLHTGNFAHFLSALENGADLRFMAEDDTTPLKFHVERWDAINEIALVWVKLPALAPGATTRVRMYFNNPGAVNAQEPPLTFDANTGAVYHFGELAGPPQDTSANANHAAASTALPVPASLIGGGVRFSGGESITISDTPSLAQAAETGFTFSAWVKTGAAPAAAPAAPAAAGTGAAAPDGPAAAAPAAGGGDGVLFDRTGPSAARLALVMKGGGLEAITQAEGAAAVSSPLSAPLAAGAWHHVALTVGATRTSVYVNGVEVTGVDAPAFALSGDITLGASSKGDAFFTGDLDEVELARVARSADYLKVATAAQGDMGTLVVIGADETEDTAGAGEGGEVAHASPFVVIIKAVFANEEALVEQIVIGVCGVMAFVSFAIMISKAIMLFGATAATAQFLKSFEKLGGDTAIDGLYDKRKAYGKSPLFRVYRVGIDEVRKRLAHSVGAAGAIHSIDSKGLTTIKAALDASMVREGQKLGASMSLLTIAISGGPFIGLFGTVVGVMVTFGAIAATGDVNIAAIAPGMAAALLATVAGLGVAIPSLFGYNYLGGIIKNVSADMHVFADELLARINEAHGE